MKVFRVNRVETPLLLYSGMKKYGIFLLIIYILSGGAVSAQSPDLLEGKKVAVYFSKKTFQFDRPYHHFLSQFIKKVEGESVLIDDLKFQSLVAIGKRFSSQLASASSIDSAFFLNERTEMVRAFINSYSTNDHAMRPLKGSMTGVDLVLVVNPFQLFSERLPVVLARSNRLVTSYDVVKHAKLSFELWDPVKGQLLRSTESCVQQRNKDVPRIVFDFQGDESEVGRFLELVFSEAVDRLATGASSNCPSSVPELDEFGVPKHPVPSLPEPVGSGLGQQKP